MRTQKGVQVRVPKKKESITNILKKNWQLYILILPAVIYFFVFNYMPLYGIQIAFKDYKAVDGIAGSAWVGWKNFTDFFHAYYFKRLLLNTLLLNIYYLLWSFPVPLILAILLNRIRGIFEPNVPFRHVFIFLISFLQLFWLECCIFFCLPVPVFLIY